MVSICLVTVKNRVWQMTRTETYIGLKAHINNWRWNGVPFYVRTGKRLPTRVTEIVIHFKNTPHPVFGQDAPEQADYPYPTG